MRDSVLVSTDIATPEYWESSWATAAPVRDFSRRNYYDMRLAELFDRFVAPSLRVLEVGCGGSKWIKYFDRIRMCETWGIDYSESGLSLTRLNNAGREAHLHLVQGDFFDETLLPSDYFDLIYSLGFVEHFSDVNSVIRRMAGLIRRGGRIVTLIPNLTSIYGYIQARIERRVYEKHVIMTPLDIDQEHTASGLVPEMPARFAGCFAPGMVNYGSLERLLLPPVKVVQHAICWGLRALHCDVESRVFSPHIVGVYRKP